MIREEIILLLERIKYGSTTTPSGREWIIREKDIPSNATVEYVGNKEKILTEEDEVLITKSNEKAI